MIEHDGPQRGARSTPLYRVHHPGATWCDDIVDVFFERAVLLADALDRICCKFRGFFMSASNLAFFRSYIPFRLAIPAVLLVAAGQALAVDWGMGVGAGDAGVKKIGLVAGWDREEPLWQGEKWQLALRHEVELGLWRIPQASNGVEVGYSPVLRLVRPLSQKTNRLFVEASVGVRLISQTRIAPDANLSTAFQFSEMLGVGYQWGNKQRNTVGLRVAHLSNGGIKKPNHGVSFGQIYMQRSF